MLKLPEAGFRYSVDKNNVDQIILADWIEASALFLDIRVSKSTISDILIEENVCSTQDMAYEVADSGWNEIGNRLKGECGQKSIHMSSTEIYRSMSWQDDLPRALLLTLSLFPHYKEWATAHRNSPLQGDIFERFSLAVLQEAFPDWVIHRAGWSPAGAKKIPQVVQDLTDMLGFPGDPDLEKWAATTANECGLDIFCFRPFADKRDALPMYLVQCASGAGWIKKLQEPSTNQWKGLLGSTVEPKRIVAIPFLLDEKELSQRSSVVNGPLLDRRRLLYKCKQEPRWLPDQLTTDILDWLNPIVADIPINH